MNMVILTKKQRKLHGGLCINIKFGTPLNLLENTQEAVTKFWLANHPIPYELLQQQLQLA